MSKTAIKAFAKLNLFLEVLNKRKDKFHNLNTLFARISLADNILLEDRKDSLIKLSCNNHGLPIDEANLCYRAAKILKDNFKPDSGISIHLRKKVPIGAGLGGGSSDAAAVLMALNSRWKLNLSKARLSELGSQIGSDVAFFIFNTKFAIGRGRGEKIKPVNGLKAKKLWFIIIYPQIKVSTAFIYRKFEDFSKLTSPKYDVNILTSELKKNKLTLDPKCLYNSLEPVTCNLYPVVNQVKKALYGIGLDKVMMSGSGPAVFGICDSLKQAQDIKKKLAKKYKNWQFFVASTI